MTTRGIGIVLAAVCAVGMLPTATFAQAARSPGTGPSLVLAPVFAEAAVGLRNVTYREATGELTEATLVYPSNRSGLAPAVLFVHWYGPESTNSNRTQFLPDALSLARRGVVSLLIDTPWSEASWFVRRDPARDVETVTGAVGRLQRAIEVLAAIENVDRRRLAYVGHDFGAMFGAAAAATSGRISQFVFVAGTGRLAEWFALGRRLDPAQREQLAATLAPHDPLTHIARAATGRTLLQFGLKDNYVPRAMADAIVAAVPGEKEAKFYDVDHAMDSNAMTDRVTWLMDGFEATAGRP